MDFLNLTNLPNLHPALVHFPIALAFTATFVDALHVLLRRVGWLERAGASLWGLGALGAVATYLSGREAADGVGLLTPAAQAALSRHADAAYWTLLLFLLVAAVRIAAAWLSRPSFRPAGGARRLLLAAIGLPVLALVGWTADRGGGLVFRHGVAVSTIRGSERAAAAPAPSGSEEEELSVVDDGSVTWRPGRMGGRALGREITLAGGGAGVFTPIPGGDAQGLRAAVDGRVFLLLPGLFGDVQVDAQVDLTRFEGEAGLVHHYRAEGDFGLFALREGQARLLDVKSGKVTELASEAFAVPAQPTSLAVSAIGGHQKGFVGGELVAHGHVEAPAEGRVGLAFEGHGEVVIRELRAFPAD